MSKVQDMQGMFNSAQAFDGDLSNWDTSSLNSSLEGIFYQATAFKGGDLTGWDVSGVTSLVGAFRLAENFQGDISTW